MSHLNQARKTVVLSYGLGVDSTAILLRWLTDPSSRDFDLADLVVMTAQTGSEFVETGELVEAHVLPRLKAAGVRFVEVARAQRRQGKGLAKFVVLQDSRAPERLHLEGRYTLAAEMLQSGTVPQSGGGHLCSIKSKAVPLEAWLEDEIAGRREHAMGYAVGEESRAKKDVLARATKGELAGADDFALAFGFSSEETSRVDKARKVRAEKGQVRPIFPLLDWGWDRATSVAFIASVTGATWPKSACTFCPFSGGRAEVLDRYLEHPLEAVEGLLMESVALALNPRAKLFKTKSLREKIEGSGNAAALAAFELELEAATWALYRVRRKFTQRVDGKFNVARSVEVVDTGSRLGMADALEAKALELDVKVERDGAIARAEVVGFNAKFDGAEEEIFSIAPAMAEAKAPRFDEATWRGTAARHAA